MQLAPHKLPYVAAFRDGEFKDVIIRVSDLPPILVFAPPAPNDYEEWIKQRPILRTAVTYFLIEADTDGVGLYSTKTSRRP